MLILLSADNVRVMVLRLPRDFVGKDVRLVMPLARIGAIILVSVIILQIDGEHSEHLLLRETMQSP